MRRSWAFARRVWRLFVDDGFATVLVLGWIAAVGVLARSMHLGAFSGPILFAGIAAITFNSFTPRRRRPAMRPRPPAPFRPGDPPRPPFRSGAGGRGPDGARDPSRPAGTPLEVLLAFLKLGLLSFGGPVAHLGYFRAELVERRRWLDERAYAELVGLCQFLPGPASSQTGFALGLLRAGPWGGLAAWAGFTLPSAALLVLFAASAGRLSASPVGTGLLHGLKLVAVSVVAQAVWGMARSLCPDRPRAAIALLATAVATLAPVSVGQLAAIALGAIGGLASCRDDAATAPPGPMALRVPPRIGAACLAAFAALLIPSLLPPGHGFAVFGAFYRSGALVFGGGHVVLPLLHDAVVDPGWVSDDAFLAGYGAAQAVPGPLFTFAAFLGAVLRPGPGGAAGAVVPLLAIFLPGLLLLVGALSFWERWRTDPAARALVRGTNAAVVGLLAAAFYDPVWDGTVRRPSDFVLVVAGFALLTLWRAPPVAVVAAGAAVGMAGAAFG